MIRSVYIPVNDRCFLSIICSSFHITKYLETDKDFLPWIQVGPMVFMVPFEDRKEKGWRTV